MTTQSSLVSTTSISALSSKKQLALGLLLFERMLPSLIIFSRDTGFDDLCYLQARDAAWFALLGGTIDPILNDNCIDSAPDTEEFTHELTSHALNAVLVMVDILDFISTSNFESIVNVLVLARDSLYLYLSGLEPSIISTAAKDDRIARHPLMQAEQHREEQDIKFLSALPDHFDDSVILNLRQRAAKQPPLFPLSYAQP
ncbi:MAG TPA: DUF416 family protein [Candidatus Angelobacter sp.]|nr:DUF416 family protein [Candidatus Angelobacter sp.]